MPTDITRERQATKSDLAAAVDTLTRERDEARAALTVLVETYIANLGTPYEFVRCVTPERIPDHWRTAIDLAARTAMRHADAKVTP